MWRRFLVFLAFALAAISACRPNAPSAPDAPEDDPAFTQPEPEARVGIDDEAVATVDTIRPGDVVAVKFLGNSELNAPKSIVDRNGHLHLSLIGDIKVGGLTATQAEKVILVRLRKFDRFSEVNVQLVDTTARTVAVTGAVERPGNVVLTGDFRLVQVLAEAGGPRMATVGDRLVKLGDISSARLVRGGEVLPVDFAQALLGHPRHNVRVQAGDVVVVPPAVSGRIVVLGNVNKPGSFAFREGVRLSETLADAGGLSEGADSQDVRILRGGYRRPKLYVANAKLLFEGRRPDPILARGDIVYVSQHWAATVGDVLDKVVPAVATAAIIATLTSK